MTGGEGGEDETVIIRHLLLCCTIPPLSKIKLSYHVRHCVRHCVRLSVRNVEHYYSISQTLSYT